jgi:hypothetical protein
LAGDSSKLAAPLQIVVVITHAQGIIDNGGFRYLFENDLPGNLKYDVLSDAYRQIGAVKAGDLLDLAVGLFPFDNPHLSLDKALSDCDPNQTLARMEFRLNQRSRTTLSY